MRYQLIGEHQAKRSRERVRRALALRAVPPAAAQLAQSVPITLPPRLECPSASEPTARPKETAGG